jgi:hypothetical protein
MAMLAIWASANGSDTSLSSPFLDWLIAGLKSGHLMHDTALRIQSCWKTSQKSDSQTGTSSLSGLGNSITNLYESSD